MRPKSASLQAPIPARPGGSEGWIARRFRRVTASGRYIPEVDGLRFVAIASVFLVHMKAFLSIKSTTAWAVPYQDDWLAHVASQTGEFGVPLFFMISGFILGLPFAAHRLKGGQPVDLRGYFSRRLTRLEPPYILSLTAFFVLIHLTKGFSWSRLTPGYLESLFYLHNIFGRDANVINAVAWSLETEVQFYILAPLLATVFAVKGPTPRRVLIVGMAYAAMALQWCFISDEGRIDLSLPNWIQFFLGGLLMADLYLVEFADRDRKGAAAWDLVGLGALPAAIWVIPHAGPKRFLLPVICFGLMTAALRGRGVRWALSRPWITAIGGMCYSIYLIHYQVISLVGRFTKDLPFSHYFWANLLIQLVVIGVPVLAVSAVFFLLVERPCMERDWPNRLASWLANRSGWSAVAARATSEPRPMASPAMLMAGGPIPGDSREA